MGIMMGLALPYTHVPLVSDFNVPHDNSETMVGGIPESMGPGRGGCALGMTLRAHVATVTRPALSPPGLITQGASDLLPPPPPCLLIPVLSLLTAVFCIVGGSHWL